MTTLLNPFVLLLLSTLPFALYGMGHYVEQKATFPFEEDSSTNKSSANLLKRSFQVPDATDAKATELLPNGDMQVFGVFQYTDGNGPKVRYCEGALIDERIVLTSVACQPFDLKYQTSQTPNNGVPSRYKFWFTHGQQDIEISPSNFYRVSKDKFTLVLLPKALTSAPKVFAFPSWSAQGQSENVKWQIREDLITNHAIRLSSWYAAMSTQDTESGTIETAVKKCDFVDKDQYIAMDCQSTDACLNLLVKDGAMFFKIEDVGVLRSVGLTGMVMLPESKNCKAESPRYSAEALLPVLSGKRKRNPKDHTVPALPKKGPIADKCTDHVCGYRFTEQDVRRIFRTVLELVDKSKLIPGTPPPPPAKFNLDTDVIPKGAIMGTMNVNGVSRWDRAMKDQVKSAILSIFAEGHIIFLQEVSASFNDKVKNDLASQGLSMAAVHAELSSVYKNNHVSVTNCASVEFNQHKYAQQCDVNFIENGVGLKCFTSYNVHLRAKDKAQRFGEMQHLRSEIDQLTPGACSNIVIIAGDFNTFTIPEAEEAIRKFGNFRFHDPGKTTPKEEFRRQDEVQDVDLLQIQRGEGHYDRVVVSDAARLFYHFHPAKKQWVHGSNTYSYQLFSQKERLQEIRQKFIPSHPSRPITPTARSFYLSDHLPVRFTPQSVNNLKLGTWNIERFDPTRKNSKGQDNGDFKELKHSTEFEEMFLQFDVLAVQELKMYADLTLFNNAKLTADKKEIINDVYGRKWVVSVKTPELGFAYDSSSVNLVSCQDLDMSNHSVAKKSVRNGFECLFEKNGKTVRLISIHVKNVGSSQATARLYITEAQKNNSYETYVVGDYNMNQPAMSTTCVHTDNPLWSYTMVVSKHVRDYVWMAVDSNGQLMINNAPGTPSCEVLNPELVKDAGGQYILLDADEPNPMKAFATWREISDHYPVFIKFESGGKFEEDPDK